MLHHIFVEGLIIRNAALAICAPQFRVVYAVMQKVHELTKTSFWNEVCGRSEPAFNVFEKHGIVKRVSAPNVTIGLAAMVVTLDEVFHVIAPGEIRTDAARRI